MRSDEELMLSVRDGDLDAFEQIVLRHQQTAWRVAYRLTGRASAAEDLAQEAFLRVLEAVPRYRSTASFRAYLLRILTRLHIDRARKKHPRYRDRLPEPPDTGPGPGHAAELAEREAIIQAALDLLPPNQRSAVVLRYFEGSSGIEISEALGVSPKAVERLLARARASLESKLGNLLEE
jgi:RNA polymerase sigma-70 factor, ECF subfamily